MTHALEILGFTGCAVLAWLACMAVLTVLEIARQNKSK